MHNPKPLSRVIAMLLSGSAVAGFGSSVANAAAVTSYNAFNHDRSAPNILVSSGSGGTDGWMRTSANACGTAGSTCGNGPATYNNPNKAVAEGNASVPWVGNDPRGASFDYVGRQTLNWTAVIDAGDTAVISKLDSNARYAGTALADGTIFNYADIDTAQGAWHDGGKSPKSTPGAGVGWKHDTDIGLFKSTVTQVVTLSIHSLLENGAADLTPDYGFTVFEGMDTSTDNYGHHGSWHAWDNQAAVGVGDNAYQITDPNPFTIAGGGDGNGLEADKLILDDVYGNNASFLAEAGKVYTIYLGGFQGGGWTFTRNDYELTISAAPVPLPGAVWLFGSAIGLLGWQRRKA
ncbi:hypothetical protein [Methylomonas sp. UP202]|uniref:hypothetical protein n=1 Tax=Methylomonas sp. UP202 TaxID=3040943 RepID=UPI002479569B|nr:hypothetical protein [Methylomonas sp. UP202]WGS84804.1 hypothetical protein QC632_17305 [Methylomonas sp. UP202]